MHETLNFIIHAFYYDNIHLEAYLKHQYCLVRCAVKKYVININTLFRQNNLHLLFIILR